MDAFSHEHGERPSLLDGSLDMAGAELAEATVFHAFLGPVVEAFADAGFDFGPGESIGGLCERLEVGLIQIVAAAAAVDVEDVGACFLVG